MRRAILEAAKTGGFSSELPIAEAELEGIRSSRGDHIPASSADVEFGEVVEAEAGIDVAGRGDDALARGKRLAMHRLVRYGSPKRCTRYITTTSFYLA